MYIWVGLWRTWKWGWRGCWLPGPFYTDNLVLCSKSDVDLRMMIRPFVEVYKRRFLEENGGMWGKYDWEAIRCFCTCGFGDDVNREGMLGECGCEVAGGCFRIGYRWKSGILWESGDWEESWDCDQISCKCKECATWLFKSITWGPPCVCFTVWKWDNSLDGEEKI